MLKVKHLFAAALSFLLLGAPDAVAQGPVVSSLNGVQLPAGAVRLQREDVPAEIQQTLGKLVALGGGKLRQGESEVLVWAGGGYRKSDASQTIRQFAGGLNRCGWTYEVGEQNAQFVVFNSASAGARRGAVGFFVVTDESLLLAWAEALPAGTTNASPAHSSPKAATADNTGRVLRVGAQTDHVNVMGDEMPAIPQFPALPKKPGYVRGHVKDTSGRPVAGAKLGLKTARMYDAYLAASTETDAEGYYEIKIPMGGGRFDYAGVTVSYGAGRAALGLHPADGRLSESYPAAAGGVENFVLLPYGVANAEDVRNNPRYRSNYYGGSLLLRYFIGGFSGMLSAGTEIEITLTPEGSLVDGSAGRSFVIRKTVEDSSLGEFVINNVPVGLYRVEVRQAGGAPLKLTQKAPTGSVFGIEPKEAAGGASLVFNPLSADPKTAVASRGNWTDLEIIVQRP